MNKGSAHETEKSYAELQRASVPAVDVLLVCPNYASTALITDAVVYPINLAVLAAYLRERSVGVAIIDGRALDYRGDDFRQAIESILPKIVGITVMSSYVNRAADIARIAKSISPEITVVVGGAHISALPSETLESYSCFDIAVVGEGEQTLYELADTTIHKKYRFEAIDGIYYREAGSIRRNRPRELIADLDSLPYPAFDLLPEAITDWDRFETCAKPFLLSDLSEEQLLRYVKRAYGKFYFRPRIIVGAIKDSLSFYKLRNNISALGRIVRLMFARRFDKKVCT